MLADRGAIDVWQAAGSRDILTQAADRVTDLLTSHRPYYIDKDSDEILRGALPIKLAPPT